MKRLFVLFLSLFTLATSLCAIPLFPQKVVKYPLANGHNLELDFFGPKDALQYFDASVLTNGFSQLSTTYNLTDDFTISFAPQNTGELLFLVSFDATDSGLGKSLHPITNAAGLRGLPLVAPRDALVIVQSWYASFLSNSSQGKPDSFVSSMRRTIFTVDYSASAPSNGKLVTLMIPGSFQNNTPVFDSKLGLTDYSTWTTYHIKLNDPSYTAALQTDYFYILDPIEDPNNPGVKRDSVMVYALFDKVVP